MYEDQEKKMLQMQTNMDSKQVFTFREKLYLSKLCREAEMRRKIKAAIKTTIQETLSLLAALGVLTIESLIVVPPLVKTRGYLAFGGEWFAMVGLAIIFWLWIRERYD
mgnify:CR=1 FL=1